ncbi:MAG: 16S rRNA (cytosine(1402)-N(4))-methyltransferase RsmH [Holosporales bacterium]|jgi:16S rRNA (cytosine1402-N4)-methyltransferase|nr:16S rRNA (cytosine(1402)-N(4))-methyltransferase RsmH [Holosporales bacterium]
MVHVPVLLNEVMSALAPQPGATYIDATFGGGGYSRRMLDAAPCRVVAIDRDPDAAVRASALHGEYGERFSFVQSNFANIHETLRCLDYSGVVFDFGVSSFQLEDDARGFSFMHDGPLDMRMSGDGATAADVVNTYSAKDLERIIQLYGDEPFARKISQAIVAHRASQPLLRTLDLANVVRSVVKKVKAIDPATKTFQALRIFVNDELREIRLALDAIAADVAQRPHLAPVCVITVTFHSLEDRIVKLWSQRLKQEGRTDGNALRVTVPSCDELHENPRSRSAKMRKVVLLSQS